MTKLVISFIASLTTSAIAVSVPSSPIVKLDFATFRGFTNESLDLFLGMPFAQPPIGNLRFATPRPPLRVKGIQSARQFGNTCPQQVYNVPGFDFINNFTYPGAVVTPQSEDCLTINVVKPANIAVNAKLPVLVYIFGGAFEIGSSSGYDTQPLVKRSMALEQPIISVSFNYRVNAFGFLPGKEAQRAGVGNVGLDDQRLGMQWIKRYISLFGGDPNRVILHGQSAGAISIALQTLIEPSNVLLHGAIMQSGSPIPLPTMAAGQVFYDALVTAANCTSTTDTLACLRAAPFGVLLNEIRRLPSSFSFTSVNLPWLPRLDDRLFHTDPIDSVRLGNFAKVPFITGDVDDEGTLFSIVQSNLSTSEQSLQYFHSNYFPSASASQIQRLGELYPADPSAGSPFNTGTANQLHPQYKRIAAIQGDMFFSAPRRRFLSAAASHGVPAWSFNYNRDKTSPLGVLHGSDIPEFFGFDTPSGPPDFIGSDAIINFVNTLNPNTPAGKRTHAAKWPEWSSSRSNPPLLQFVDNGTTNIRADTFRKEGMELLNTLPLFRYG